MLFAAFILISSWGTVGASSTWPRIQWSTTDSVGVEPGNTTEAGESINPGLGPQAPAEDNSKVAAGVLHSIATILEQQDPQSPPGGASSTPALLGELLPAVVTSLAPSSRSQEGNHAATLAGAGDQHSTPSGSEPPPACGAPGSTPLVSIFILAWLIIC
jgi:hypothetical protein